MIKVKVTIFKIRITFWHVHVSQVVAKLEKKITNLYIDESTSCNLILSRSNGVTTDSTNQFSGTCIFCVSNDPGDTSEKLAIGPFPRLPSDVKRNSGSSTYR